MGTYTNLRFKFKLAQDCPEDVCNFIHTVAFDTSDDWLNVINSKPKTLSTHPLFLTDRWYCAFGNFTGSDLCKIKYCAESGVYDIVATVKNYEQLMDKFVGFLIPFLDTVYCSIFYYVFDECGYDGSNSCYVYDTNCTPVAAIDDAVATFGARMDLHINTTDDHKDFVYAITQESEDEPTSNL